MQEITFQNYKTLLYNGARVLYNDRVGLVEFDSGWNGSYKINGRSIINLLEEFDVYLVR